MSNGKSPHGSEIAIVGMSGRFPGAEDVRAFWRNLAAGVEAVRTLTDDQLLAAGANPDLLRQPGYVKAASVLEGIELFDAEFFGYPPREAEIMDPQHRLFLECCWEALEEAGYDPEKLPGLAGVFAGSGFCTYLLKNLAGSPELLALVGDLQTAVGNERDSLTSTVSYKLNLKGPSIAVQTFCSTSLVATHLACQSLLNYECDMALAGGVAISLPQGTGYLYQEGGILSPDGRCRTFDAAARGSIMGNGVGVVALKRYEDALAAGDPVYALIKGSAVNNDGIRKVGYTAPGLDGQAAVIAEALANAGVSPEALSYYEAHGTATPLGDSIEIAALKRAFSEVRRPGRFCAIGSAKPNIGHLDRASGVTGLIKTALALHHGQIPPSLHCVQPNPEFELEASPFYVNTALAEWPAGEEPRRAGVSSFGLGGTNAHVVLEEAPPPVPGGPSRPWQLLLLSAKTATALAAATERLAHHLEAGNGVELADVAYTLAVGRSAFNHRRTIVGRDAADVVRALREGDRDRVADAAQRRRDRPIVFLLPGVGDHYPGMARDLYASEPLFRRELDRCAELLVPHLGLDLRGELFPAGEEGEEASAKPSLDLRALLDRNAVAAGGTAARLHETWLAQPAVFAVEYALAHLLASWGIRPQAMIGYSLGEYVAACLAGVLSAEDALSLVAERARLIHQLPAGAMLAVSLAEAEVLALPALRAERLSLAVVNGPRVCVVAGPPEEVDALAAELAAQGVACRRLQTTHAFHSRLMEPIAARFREVLRKVRLNPPAVRYVSNVTGDWITEEEATDPEYWVRHLCGTVRFEAGLQRLLADPESALLEVGPGQSLSALVRQHPEGGGEARTVLPTLRAAFFRQHDTAYLLSALGKLWLAGVEIDWQAFWAGEERRRQRLPTYPFERRRYWVDAMSDASPLDAAARAGGAKAKKEDVGDWFYRPSWSPVEPVAATDESASSWLVFADGTGVGERLAARLRTAGRAVVTVEAGERFRRLGDGGYALDPRSPEDYRSLIAELRQLGRLPEAIAHLWLLAEPEEFARSQDRGFYSLLWLAQALGAENVTRPMRLLMVSQGVQEVTGEEVLLPEQATVLGACRVLSQEYPHLHCRNLDVDPAETDWLREELAGAVIAELSPAALEASVAWRGGRRWVERFTPLRLEKGEALRRGGVYLITGGLGGVGLVLARHLAERYAAKLVLTSRAGLPERESWEEALERRSEADPVRQRIAAVRSLEELGGEVLVLAADAADEERMRQVVALAAERFGDLDGVVHAAGISGSEGFRVVQQIRREDCELHFVPKVAGLRVLERVLAGREPGFCLLMSSLSAVLGGITLSGYSAANAFMDAFVRRHNREAGSTAWRSINWDTWQLKAGQHGVVGRTVAVFEMTPEEGAEAFERAVGATGEARLVNSTGDLAARLAQWVERRGAPPLPAAAPADFQSPRAVAGSELERRIAEIWHRVLGVEQPGVHDNYFDLGGTSLNAIQVVAELQRSLNVQVSPILLFEAPTIRDLARRLGGTAEEPQPGAVQRLAERRRRRREEGGREQIAIIGMAGRFPGAEDVEGFWRNLRDGVESLTLLSDEELAASGVPAEVYRDPAYVRLRPVVDGIDLFDAQFFGYSPREATFMDPQHRLFVEVAWQALEDAGYDSLRYPGSIGVFGGSNISGYWIELLRDPQLMSSLGDLETMIASDRDSLATRVSYKLNLRGPSFTVQTFCSTSAVAVHLACQSLLSGDCDIALAGGVSLKVPQRTGYLFAPGDQASVDGHTRTFDAAARGTVFGDGAGLVVLKRLSEALADGDAIRAVIRGTAINNDGSGKVGYTAPSVDGQAEVVAMALANAGVGADEIDYVEAHGTATELGDPIEVAALSKAFRSSTPRQGFCAIGSVKTNVGHLDRAAGVTAIVKTVLALEHGEIPGMLHFERPNPKIDFATSPFFVNTELRSWPSSGRSRRAGVNSLGVGGTNVHLVLEEAPAMAPGSESRPWQLLAVSARTETALEAATERLARHLEERPDLDLADVAYTLQAGRRGLEHRRVALVRGLAEAPGVLRGNERQRVWTQGRVGQNPQVAFLLPGLGDHYTGMSLGLYRREGVFREALDRCVELLRPELGLDLREVLFPGGWEGVEEEGTASGPDLRKLLRQGGDADSRLSRTEVAQPVLFAVEYALVQLLASWGIRPQALIGYSLGEYVAACLAGIFSLPDALRLVARRARLIGSLPAGSMLAVLLGETELVGLLGEELSVAAVNGPRLSVVAGPEAAVAALEAALAERQVVSRRLQTTHAFHSRMMEPIRDDLVALVRGMERHAPQIPLVSNLTGTWLDEEEAQDPEYWGRHLCETVRFEDGIECLLAEPERLFVEVGPGQGLGSFLKLHPQGGSRLVVPALRASFEGLADQAYTLAGLGRLWLAGVEMDWAGFYGGETRRRVPLPTYPFERQSYWIEPQRESQPLHLRYVSAEEKAPLADWFYEAVWRPAEATAEPAAAAGDWLLLAGAEGPGTELAGRLAALGARVVTARPGVAFGGSAGQGYTLDPRRGSDFARLLRELRDLGRFPARIVHLWSLETPPEAGLEDLEAAQWNGFHSLLLLAQALGEQSLAAPVEVIAVGRGLAAVTAAEVPNPAAALVLGPVKVIGQEYEKLSCRAVDFATGCTVGQLAAELAAGGGELLVALRPDGARWVREFVPRRLEAPATPPPALRRDGVYLITGGLGGLGLALAAHLHATLSAKLVLVSRAGAPPREQWDALAAGGEPAKGSPAWRVQRLRELEAAGAELLVEAAEVSDLAAMTAVVARARERFGALHGVFHLAGVPGEGLIQRKTPQAAERVLTPKVRGTLVLDALLGGQGLDLLVLFSSMSAITGGGPGQSDYCAANAFLDAFGRVAAGRYGRSVAVGWGEWQWDAWDAGLGGFQREVQEYFKATRRKFGIPFADGMEALERILASELAHAVVSTQDFNVMVRGSADFTAARILDEIGRHRPAQSAHPRPVLGVDFVPATGELERQIAEVWQRVLGIEKVGIRDNFFDLGGSSLIGLQVVADLKQELGLEIPAVALYQAPTVSQLARYLSPEQDLPESQAAREITERRRQARRQSDHGGVAIIGMAGRFPGAHDVAALWRNVLDGVEAITFFSDEELLAAGVAPEMLAHPGYVKAGAVLDDIEMFDARLFGYSPREAEIMDPQHRLFLQCAWEALENAGYDPDRYSGLIGLFGGADGSTYVFNLLANAHQAEGEPLTYFQAGIGNTNDSLTTRASYKLNLKGPSVTVQTFCSTSAVATHMASRSLLHGECDLALAGGVRVHVPHRAGYVYQEGGIEPPDGHTRTFDARGRGAVLGNGVALVVLKRFADALADGDTIYAVIKGSAINNDGSLKVGYTAPSVEGQAAVVEAALDDAGVDVETISYVEAHGTATELGDPIELAALTKTYRAHTRDQGFCTIGSIKPNVGHLDRASGATALIKTALSLKHRLIPPSINFAEPNPKIDFASSPFRVVTELRPWEAREGPLRAGVNSVGLGGTNVHFILEEAPPALSAAPARPWQLLLLSAKTPEPLEAATDRLSAWLESGADGALADAAYTLQVGRRRLEHRRMVVCRDRADAAAALSSRDPKRVLGRFQAPVHRSVAFLLPGLGDHYVQMARGLYEAEEVFREELDRCARLLAPALGLNLCEALFPAGEPQGRQGMDLRALLGNPRGERAAESAAAQRLGETWLAQPAVFAVDYALARLWMSWGVRPQALLGYSLGEYVAACLSGVFRLEDALELVTARARLIHALPAGAMLAVTLPEAAVLELAALRQGRLSLAAVNGPAVSVASGPPQEVEALEEELAARGVVSRRLQTTHAFHSRMMEPIVEELRQLFAGIALGAPRVPYVSNVTGDWITAAEATDPEYWVRHLCGTVRFGEGLGRLLEEPSRLLLEVGPGQSLGAFASQHPSFGSAGADHASLASLPYALARQDDQAFLLTTLGRLWLAGVEPDWDRFHGAGRRRIPLPTYPFERQRYWIEARPQVAAPLPAAAKRADVGDWFYRPSWSPAEPVAAGEPASSWLVFDDGTGVGERLAARLRATGRTVVTVETGEQLHRLGDGGYALDPRSPEDYRSLIAELRQLGRLPEAIAHLWLLAGPEEFARSQDRGFYSLLWLAQALGAENVTRPMRLLVVSQGVQEVTGEEVLLPEQATVLGACRVLSQEYPHLHCRSLDVDPAETDWLREELAGVVMAELSPAVLEAGVAWRGGRRWVERFTPLRLEKGEALRRGGVYLITGGLGGVGLVLARHLAGRYAAKLVLTSRAGLPERESWEEELERRGEADPVRQRIAAVRSLEELGGEVLVLAADAADEERMRQVVALAAERFGDLDGVVHAAGISGSEGFRVVQQIRREDCELHFVPKVAGLQVLERVLAGREPGFCLLMSSLSAVLGGITLSGYSAANAFMDAFVRRHNRETGGAAWRSINWDTWHLKAGQHGVVGRTVAVFEMTPEEGAEAFERAVGATGEARLVNSTGDLAARLAQWVERREPARGPAAGEAPPTLYSRPHLQTAYVAAEDEAERRIAAVWQRILGIGQVGIHDNYFDMGGTSLTAIQVVSEIQKEFEVQISPIALFEAPTVSDLAKLLRARGGEGGELSLKERVDRRLRLRRGAEHPEIAIIGMAGRFPGAEDVAGFWRNLRDGVESLTLLSDEDLAASGVPAEVYRDPAYVRLRPVVDGIDLFDAQFFGYSPREATFMDPQHRLFVEVAWQALEDAGYDSLRYPGSIGVFGGSNISGYWIELLRDPQLMSSLGDLETMIASDRDSLATRVSYKLSLRGPSFTVQTFCSTSAVAVHLACQSLLSGDCDIALAGGVSLKVPQRTGYLFAPGDQASVDGHTRTFDAAARGTVFGDGAGLVVLKRLSEALADGDAIRAVIRGTAINNDGSGKVGYTAPSVDGQAEVVAMALANAGVGADEIDYVEAHGTATELGDPIEVAALSKAFRSSTPRQGFCAIGSVKTNVGHLDRAAGVTAIVKTVLALEHGEIPGMLHFERPNPKIDFAASPFFVNTELRSWPSSGRPRRAGVNSLGVGGTNVHLVLEEAPAVVPGSVSRPWQLLAVSARTETALEAATERLARHLEERPDLDLADVAYTLQAGRRGLEHRRVALVRSLAEAPGVLRGNERQRVWTQGRVGQNPQVVFLLPGLGDHYTGMSLGLYRREGVFREALDRCVELLRPELGLDLREMLFPGGWEGMEEEGTASGPDLRKLLRQGGDVDSRLSRTEVAQPVLFAVEYALAQLLASWGIRPQALLGYSLGEYVAACLAGVFSLPDALRLVARRAQMIGRLEAGSMLAVLLGEAELVGLLSEELSVAAVNGPRLSVVSGPEAAVAALEAELAQRQVVCRRLQTTHAFHSRMMEPIREELVALVRGMERHAPRIPLVSNVTGTWLGEEEALDPEYWGRHLCQPVRFEAGIERLLEEPERLFVEVGPGQGLGSFLKLHPQGGSRLVVPALRASFEGLSDQAYTLAGLGRLWLAGVEVDWTGFYGDETRRRVPLPTYPFERQRYWIEPQREEVPLHLRFLSVEEKAPLDDWFYEPVWQPAEAVAESEEPAGPTPVEARRWLLFLDACGVGAALAERLRAAGAEVLTVEPGDRLTRLSADIYRLHPGWRPDYDTLIGDLARAGRLPDEIVHLWTVAPEGGEDVGLDDLEEALYPGFYSLTFLAQALGERGGDRPLRITVVSSGVRRVTGDEALSSARAMVLGPCKVINQEYAHLSCRSIDVAAYEAAAEVAGQLLAELAAARGAEVVALRGGGRFVRRFEPRALPRAAEVPALRRGGAYLITGGLGGLGLALADHLFATYGARLALVGRSPLPPREEWERVLAGGSEGKTGAAARIRRVQALESAGAELAVLAADVADGAELARAVTEARERFGRIDGVFHLAGIPGEGLIQLKTPEISARVLGPKVRGTLALESIFRDAEPDFLVLFSSMSSVTGGGPGQMDYCAANTFLDVYAERHAGRHGRTVAIGWGEWQWDAWDAGLTGFHREVQDYFRETRRKFGIGFAEGMEALSRILAADRPHLVVATQEFNRMVAGSSEFSAANILGEMERNRASLPAHPRPALGVQYVAAKNDFERAISSVWQRALGIEQIGIDDNFFDLGGSSLIGLQVIADLGRELGLTISPVALYEAPTISQLARYLSPEPEPELSAAVAALEQRRRDIRRTAEKGDIAIIGCAGRFPQAQSVEELWSNLVNGRECITFLSDEELLAAGVDRAALAAPNYVRAASRLDGVELFDAQLFGYSPREAEAMDPQHRVFMECAWHALEEAGYDSYRYPGLIGIFGGANRSSYLFNIYSHPDLVENDPVTHVQAGIGNTNDSLTTRISYKLNLKGPSVAVQTFCSTSAVAIHMARQSLLHGECDMALAGGIRIELPQDQGYFFEEGGIFPSDGHTRTFDARADGSVLANGVAIVVLKRLADAIADGDHVYAVIKGSAINNDGSLKVGYTAPSVEGQAQVVRAALDEAGIDVETIHYLEAHGTATELGDPIEVAALTKAFRSRTDAVGFCHIGSVKPNLGHLDRAAGATAVIKTALVLDRGLIPPNINFTTPNPKIDFAGSPFQVSTELRRWETNGAPRRASVNVLGMGGTNVHMILEEAPALPPSSGSRPWQLLLLSAHTETSLEAATDEMAAHLAAASPASLASLAPLADIAYTLQVGRRTLPLRRMLVCRSPEDAAAALAQRDPLRVLTRHQVAASRSPVFLFAGLGDHYVDMALGLYRDEPAFRDTVDRCARILRPHLGCDLRDVLFRGDRTAAAGEAAAPAGPAMLDLRALLNKGEAPADEATARLNRTAFVHPALFTVEYALARLLMDWGIRPRAAVGYSLGEYVAACVAGVFSLEDALTLVARRARMIEELPPGGMLAVSLSAEELTPLLGEGLSLAAVNGPALCVAAGLEEAVESLAGQLAARGVVCRRLQTSHAFHSAMMEPIVKPFTDLVASVRLSPPRLPLLSTVTGTWLTAEEATDPAHWARHMSLPVRFAAAAAELRQDPDRVLIEVGPGQSLGAFVQMQPVPAGSDQLIVPTLRHVHDHQPDTACLLGALGRLWQGGVEIDWASFYARERRQRLSLPLYPFDRQRYWIDFDRDGFVRRPVKGKKKDIGDWFYLPGWKPSLAPGGRAVRGGLLGESGPWLVFVNGCELGRKLLERLREEAGEVVAVRVGERFARLADGEYEIDLQRQEDYQRLLADLDRPPSIVVHMWSLGATDPDQAPQDRFDTCQELGLYSLLSLARAADRYAVDQPIEIVVLASGLSSVTGAEPLFPEKATLLAACNTVPQEFPGLALRSVDLALPAPGSRQETLLLDHLLGELAAGRTDRSVAYRAGVRWVRSYEPVRLESVDHATTKLRAGGVYLITGGLGGVGLILAEHLARGFQAKLVLTGRSALPQRDEWAAWLETHGDGSPQSVKIRQLQALEDLGSEVLVLQADAAEISQMRQAVAAARERFGALHGVIHAAGVSGGEGFGLLQDIGRRECELHFLPKVRGLFALEQALQGLSLDFCLLMSSLSSVLGGVTLGAYSAANLFMDAFLELHNRGEDTPWIAVNWDTWHTRQGQHEIIGKTVAEYEMSPDEGFAAFERAVSLGTIGRLVNSTGDLEARIDQWIRLRALQRGEAKPAQRRHDRPNLATRFVAPETPREQAIAELWQELLGIGEVGRYDNFFDLGGHSLLGIQLFARLREAFQVELPLRSLFETPTVAGQADVIETLRWMSEDEPAPLPADIAIVEGEL